MGQKVIRVILDPNRRSLMEYLLDAGDDRFGALGVSTRGDACTPYATGVLPRLEQAIERPNVGIQVHLSLPAEADGHDCHGGDRR